MNKHPNAIVGGTAGIGGGEIAVEVLDVLGVHVSGPAGVLIAGALTAVALFVGRRGLRGVWRVIVNGTGG